MKWSKEKANTWYETKKWMVGFNFLPKSAINATEMWQVSSYDKEEIQKELQLARDTGFNSCRVFLPYVVWKNEGEKFIERMREFLEIAGSLNISVMPVLFDDCAFSNKEPFYGKQDEPVSGVHNSGWTPSPGFEIVDDEKSWEDLRRYVQTIIKAFKEDERICVWDVYNEPGNSERKEKSLPLLKKTFEWARACNPSQPLTAAVWAWEDFEKEYPGELCDVISFHSYTDPQVTLSHINRMKKYKRPILCTEWLHREAKSCIATHMPIFKEHKIGIYNWGLVKGKTQTHLNWSTINGEPNPNPEVWQHDLFDEDYTPYRQEEISFIERIMEI